MTDADLKTEIESELARTRDADRTLVQLEQKVAKKKAKITETWDEARFAVNVLQSEIGQLQRDIRSREFHLKQKIRLEILRRSPQLSSPHTTDNTISDTTKENTDATRGTETDQG